MPNYLRLGVFVRHCLCLYTLVCVSYVYIVVYVSICSSASVSVAMSVPASVVCRCACIWVSGSGLGFESGSFPLRTPTVRARKSRCFFCLSPIRQRRAQRRRHRLVCSRTLHGNVCPLSSFRLISLLPVPSPPSCCYFICCFRAAVLLCLCCHAVLMCFVVLVSWCVAGFCCDVVLLFCFFVCTLFWSLVSFGVALSLFALVVTVAVVCHCFSFASSRFAFVALLHDVVVACRCFADVFLLCLFVFLLFCCFCCLREPCTERC